MPITFIRQIIDKIVDESLYHGQASIDFTIDGQTPDSIEDFKNVLELKLKSLGNGEVPNIDLVLTESPVLTQSRLIDVAAFIFKIITTAYPSGLFSIDNDSGRALLGDFDGVVNGTCVKVDDPNQITTYTANNGHLFNGVPAFADNAAAVTGDLQVGMLYYRTGHGLDIVI